jgi:hypothetical protein
MLVEAEIQILAIIQRLVVAEQVLQAVTELVVVGKVVRAVMAFK